MAISIDWPGVQVEQSRFPGGEAHVRLTADARQPCGEALIDVVYRGDQDMVAVLMAVDAIRRMAPYTEIHLSIPYLPYARQDRVCNPGEAHSLRVLSDLLNSQGFASVTAWDVHSSVAEGVINRFVSRPLYALVTPPAALRDCVLVAPDAGASKRVLAFAQHHGYARMVQAEKVRDTKTGAIVATAIELDPDYGGDYLIVDDICDGGRTFIELAKVIKKTASGKVYLLVTHGIFSKGAEVFDGLLDGVFTANLMGKPHPFFQELSA